MTAIKQLKEYPNYKRDLKNLYTKLEAIQEERLGQGVSYGELKANRDRISDKTGEVAVRIIELTEQIQREINKAEKRINLINNSLNQLENIERVAVITRYIYNQPYITIAKDCNVSVYAVKQARSRGITKLNRLLQKKSPN